MQVHDFILLPAALNPSVTLLAFTFSNEETEKYITSFFSKRVAISDIEDGGKHSSISSMINLKVK